MKVKKPLFLLLIFALFGGSLQLLLTWVKANTNEKTSTRVYKKLTRDKILTLDPSKVRFRANSQVIRAIYGQLVQLDQESPAFGGRQIKETLASQA